MNRNEVIEHPSQSELVHQHQFGLIAPRNDRNGITRLLIPNLLECFVFSVHDPLSQVAVGVHIDDLRKFPELAIDILQLLMRYETRSCRIRTSNIAGPSSKHAEEARQAGAFLTLTGSNIAARRRLIQAVCTIYEEEKVLDPSDENQGEDLGSAPGAYIDMVEGHKLAEGRFKLTPEQIARIMFEKKRYAAALAQNRGLLPFIPSYIPDDGLREFYGPIA